MMRAEMCAAFDLDPPLAVDVGIGEDWLAAKVEWIEASQLPRWPESAA